MGNINMPVGIFDSGIGGLTVLEELAKIFPHESFIYIADQGHCPYGTKTNEQIAARVEKIAAYLTGVGVKAIVIACNTASIHIESARRVASSPVISVIPPTCAHAVKVSKNKKVAVLATDSTISNGAYQKLLEQYGAACVPLACQEFVEFVENNDIDAPEGYQIVADKLSQIKNEDFDTLIFGCTHFPLLEKQIRAVLGNNINYVACGQPTGAELERILNANGLLKGDGEGNINIFTTGDKDTAIRSMKWFKAPHSPLETVVIE